MAVMRANRHHPIDLSTWARSDGPADSARLYIRDIASLALREAIVWARSPPPPPVVPTWAEPYRDLLRRGVAAWVGAEQEMRGPVLVEAGNMR